jgi:hypothetical protein
MDKMSAETGSTQSSEPPAAQTIVSRPLFVMYYAGYGARGGGETLFCRWTPIRGLRPVC